MVTEEEIQSLKTMEKKELFELVSNDVTSTNDWIGQIIRTHLWAEIFIDGIIFQDLENSKKKHKRTFAEKQDLLFESGLIDETHYKELQILNHIRNLYVHEIYPHEKALEAIRTFPSYKETKKALEAMKFPYDKEAKKALEAMKKFPFYTEIKNNPKFLEYQESVIRESSIFGLISSFLTVYLMLIFWNSKINS